MRLCNESETPNPKGKAMRRLLAHLAMLLFVGAVLRLAWLASVLP